MLIAVCLASSPSHSLTLSPTSGKAVGAVATSDCLLYLDVIVMVDIVWWQELYPDVIFITDVVWWQESFPDVITMADIVWWLEFYPDVIVKVDIDVIFTVDIV